ncbi:serine hydrolase [Candidatus Marinimicrobia bacterium]|nr:serine hydrolase [Candidatus Neomarinimicrobiota bacterium]
MLNRFNNFILLFALLINSILFGDLLEKRIRQDFTQNSFETYERISYRNEQELVNLIESLVQINNIPGASVAVVKDDRIVLKKYFGFSNLSQNIPVNENTKFILSSVTKTVTATALMQLFEQDLFELDDDIGDYLPFRVIHPDHPQATITFRMLLTHTSGIKDNWSVMTYYNGDSTYDLSNYIYDYFHPQGAIYNPNLNFNNSYPGTTFEYSNNAVALIGLLVEQLSGDSFNTYCRQNIFNPLGMNDTYWFLSEIENLDEVAFPYRWISSSQNSCFEMGCGTNDDNLPCFCDLNCVSYGDCCSDYQSVCGESGTGANPNNLVENNHYGYSDYPSGQLRSTSNDMAKFMAIFLNEGVYDGVRILDNSTIELMKTIQNPSISSSQGLIWYYKNESGRELFGHNGGDIGSSTEMFISFEDNIGVIVLTNTANYSTTIEIENALFDYAETAVFSSIGDINADSFINIQDVILMVNLILNQNYNELADINSDQIIDILDVVQIVGIILR